VGRPAVLLQLCPGAGAEGGAGRRHRRRDRQACRAARPALFPLSGAALLGTNFTDAFLLRGAYAPIGVGAWIGTIMLLNVWLLIWPNQKKILGLVPADEGQKNRARRIAMLTSRANTALSLPLLFFMAAGAHPQIYFGN
jgi:uncharacterized membrane protein